MTGAETSGSCTPQIVCSLLWHEESSALNVMTSPCGTCLRFVCMQTCCLLLVLLVRMWLLLCWRLGCCSGSKTRDTCLRYACTCRAVWCCADDVGLFKPGLQTSIGVLHDVPWTSLNAALHFASSQTTQPAAVHLDVCVCTCVICAHVWPSPLLLQGLSFDDRVFSRSHHHAFDNSGQRVCVSWMGVWKGPSSPCFRRLDIKTYLRAALPYAVIYFSSGQDCSRALR